MNVRAPDAAGAAVGVGVAAVAGAVLGGPWWAAAAVAAGGVVAGRNGSLVQAVATLALVGGAAGAGATWLVPVLVAGAVLTVEAGALGERSTGPPRRDEVLGALARPALAGLLATAVLVLGELAPSPSVAAALLAAVATAAALAAARP